MFADMKIFSTFVVMVARSPLERKVKDLIPHSQSSAFYGTNDDNFEELVKSIRHFGILQPLVVHGNVVQVGVRRLRAAIEIGLETVPVIESDDSFALPKVVASQLHRNKPLSLIIKELAFLDEAYGFRQGSRTDLRKDVFDEVQKWKETLAGSTNAMMRLRRITRMSTVAFENDPKGYDSFLAKLDDGSMSVTKALEALRVKISQNVTNKHDFLITQRETSHRLYNKDASGFEDVEDSSVQCIVTSPPYFKMRDFGVGKNQLGQEKTANVFARRLAHFMNDTRRVLKPEGSMWVVINDCILKGSYTMAPQMFALYMRRHGWLLNDEIIWRKPNPTPPNAPRTVRAHEYIYHFVLSPDFKYNDISSDEKRHTYSGSRAHNFVNCPSVNNSRKTKICENLGLTFNHHATFPEYIPLIPILLTSDPGDLVMDMFAGTGTTGIVAKQVGRDFVGYELNPEYHQVAEALLTHYNSLAFDEPLSSSPKTPAIAPRVEHARSKEEDDFFKEEDEDWISDVA
jgi:DNA modification methylase